MKITRIDARVLKGRPEKSVVFAAGRYPEFSAVLVTIETDEGIIGYGESIARSGGEATKEAVEKLFAPLLVGKDPEKIEGLYLFMVNQLRRFGHSAGIIIEAISGIDTALWDIAGKKANKPIRDLLYGAGREELEVYASSVYIADTAEMIAETKEQMAKGHTMIKLKSGHSKEAGGKYADIEKIRAIRESVGDKVELGLDANSAYDSADAVWMAKRLEDLDICFFEEPVHPDDLDGYAAVRQHSSVPLAGGETVFLAYGFRKFLERGLLDVVQPDLARCGGITGARHAMLLTHAFGARFAPHTGFSGGISHLAALQVAAAAPELYKLEYMFIDNPLREIFVGGYPVPGNGKIKVPTAPGLGLELDLDLVDKYTVA